MRKFKLLQPEPHVSTDKEVLTNSINLVKQLKGISNRYTTINEPSQLFTLPGREQSNNDRLKMGGKIHE